MSIRARQTGKQLDIPTPSPVHLLRDTPVRAWDTQTLLLREFTCPELLWGEECWKEHEELWHEGSGEESLLQGGEDRTGDGRKPGEQASA